MQGSKERRTYVQMRRNVRKSVALKFKHFEVRVRAIITTKGKREFESVLPLIKIKYLKRLFIRDEILYELRKVSGIVSADLDIEIFSVYGTATYIGEYKRYLGELDFFMSSIDDNEKTTYSYKDSVPYFKQPGKSDFIEEGV